MQTADPALEIKGAIRSAPLVASSLLVAAEKAFINSHTIHTLLHTLFLIQFKTQSSAEHKPPIPVCDVHHLAPLEQPEGSGCPQLGSTLPLQSCASLPQCWDMNMHKLLSSVSPCLGLPKALSVCVAIAWLVGTWGRHPHFQHHQQPAAPLFPQLCSCPSEVLLRVHKPHNPHC